MSAYFFYVNIIFNLKPIPIWFCFSELSGYNRKNLFHHKILRSTIKIQLRIWRKFATVKKNIINQ